MKRKLLFMVAMLTMLWAGMTTANASVFRVMGEKVQIKDGTTSIGHITIDQEDRVLRIVFGQFPDQKLTVPADVDLITYSGQDFDAILVGFEESLEITHDHSEKAHLFSFFGGDDSADPYPVYFGNASTTEDVTVTINGTSEIQYQPIFHIINVRLLLNPLELREALSNKKDFHKLNFDINTASDYVFSCNSSTRAYVDLGYGDYHFKFTNKDGKGDVFHNNIIISGLGRLDSYDAHNYISIPHGLYCQTVSVTQAGVFECDGSTNWQNRYLGEVTLKYATSEWTYFDDDEISDYRIVQTCDGTVTLQITGAGDLSSLDPDELPWLPVKDYITNVEVNSNLMVPLTKLPESAFAEFKALTSANLAGITDMEELPANLFLNCPKLSEVYLPSMGLKSIGRKAFYDCKALTTLELPEMVEQIGDSAFYHCAKSEVTLPKGIRKVGFRAFNDCHIVKIPKDIGEGEDVECVEREEGGNRSYYVFELTRLVFEGTLEEWLARDNKWIMRSRSYNNYSTGGHLNIDGKDLEDLVIPEGITEIKPHAFRNTVHIKSVKFPSTLTKIGEMSFRNCGLEAIDLPDNITELDESSFEYCEKAATLKLPKNLTVIPESAFGNCEALTDITWPENLTTIGVGAFEDCPSLTTLKLPETVTTVSHNAFSGCESLMEVTMPKSLKSISPIAFAGCMSLKKLTIPAGMGDVEELEKEEIIKEVLKDVPEEMHELYLMQLYFPWVTEIRFGGDLNEWLGKSRPWLMENVAIDYVDYIDEKEVEVKQTADLYLGDSDEPLKSVVVPDDVTEIPAYAFRKTSVTDLSVPAGVTSVGAEAFEGCHALATAECKAALPPTLGEDAFAGIHEDAELDVFASAVADYEASDWSKYFIINAAFEGYRVTINVNPAGSGTVTGAGFYKTGETAILEATPAEGYRFLQWSDGNTDNPREIVVSQDLNLNCIFEAVENGIEDINENDNKTQAPHKIMRNGVIYILKADKMYDLLGAEVK